MEVRYDGSDPNTTDMELVSYSPTGSQMANLNTLLLWNEEDPPDDAERRRNDLIYTDYQHNRNPFIDHPEWVQAIWGTGTPNGGGTQPIAQMTTLSSSAVETPNSSASLQVSLNQFAGTNGVSVSFTMSGTATPGADYSVTGQGVTFDPNTGTGTVLIPANYNSPIISVVPVADGVTEPTETATLTITAGTGYTVVPGKSATVSITDSPALPASWNFDGGAPYTNPLQANSGSGAISFAAWHGTITSFSGRTGLALALVRYRRKQLLDRLQLFDAKFQRAQHQLLHPRHQHRFHHRHMVVQHRWSKFYRPARRQHCHHRDDFCFRGRSIFFAPRS